MIETIAIVIGVATGLGAIGGFGYKLYNECYRPQQAQEIHVNTEASTPPSPMLDRVIKDAVKHHLDGCDSDEDTEIEIKIHVHHKERDSNGSK
jgi:uncharacterized membrane protein YebE (DUF533 family)